MTQTAPRTVIHVAAGITAEHPARQDRTKPSQRPSPASKRTLFVLCGLLYMAASLGYALITTRTKPSVSDPQLWMVFMCLPYVVIMIWKLLSTIRSMEDSDIATITSGLDQDLESQDGDEECTIGSDPSHGVIAVVGDVCVYVVVLLLFCHAMLPHQVRAGGML